MIIELCGLPGCGKTTLVDSFKTNSDFISREDFLNNSSFIFKLYRKTIYFSYWKLNFLKSTRILKRFLRHYPGVEKKRINRLLDMYCAVQFSNAENNYFLDEGPLQYLSAISIKQPITDNGLKDVLDIFYGKINATIYCRLDQQTALERIKNRNRTHDRYNIEDDDAKELLEYKKNNIEFLFSAVSSEKFVFDGSDSSKKELFELLDHYFGRGGKTN